MSGQPDDDEARKDDRLWTVLVLILCAAIAVAVTLIVWAML